MISINLKAIDFKLPADVINGVKRSTRSANIAFLKHVGPIARRKMRKKVSVRRGRGPKSKPSRPFEPPKQILGHLHRRILWTVDERRRSLIGPSGQSVVIGPTLRSGSRATRALEHGGWSRSVTKKKRKAQPKFDWATWHAQGRPPSRRKGKRKKKKQQIEFAGKFYVQKRPFAKPTLDEVHPSLNALLDDIWHYNFRRNLKRQVSQRKRNVRRAASKAYKFQR